MNGSRMCTIEMYTPTRLNTSSSGLSITPMLIRALLIRPPDCSSTIQAATRTRIEVQNGSNTRIISRLLWRAGKLASRYANG
ncbi:hypothetical protein D3C76_1473720 [compost metagenome]